MLDNLQNELNIGDEVIVINNSQIREGFKPALTIGYIVGFTKLSAKVYIRNSSMLQHYAVPEDRTIEDSLIEYGDWSTLSKMYSCSLHKSHFIIKR